MAISIDRRLIPRRGAVAGLARRRATVPYFAFWTPFLLWGVMTGAMLAVAGCGQKTKPPLFVVNNDKYALSADFFGAWVGPDQDRFSQFSIEKVVVRDTRSNETAEFRHAGADVPDDSVMYFRDVWSPDREYLVLPAGHLDGFAVFNSRGALAAIRENHATDLIAIRYRGQSQSLSHRFLGWTSASILRFEVQFETSKIPFSYDLERRELSSPSDAIPVFDAAGRDGSTPIQWTGSGVTPGTR